MITSQATAIAAKEITINAIPEKMKSAPNAMAIREKEFISKSMFKLLDIRNMPKNMRAKAISSIFQASFLLLNCSTPLT